MNSEKDFSVSMKIWDWISKVFQDALSKVVVTLLITYLLPFLATALLSIPLSKMYLVPLWVILLTGSTLLVSLIYLTNNLIRTKKAKSQTEQEPELEEIPIIFEKFPREWRGKFLLKGKEWKPQSDLEVYCTNHKLKLIIHRDQYLNFTGKPHDKATFTECPDCRNENTIYQDKEWPHWPPGLAIHTPTYWPELKQEILNRMERELQKKEIKR
ncbi:MAG: hypothetical protein H6636_00495 [Anaerolineales bacterium]|nr:hypothetical protein [Anaerolineales bacterium]